MRGHKLQRQLHGIAPLVGAALVGAAANIFGQDRANRGNIKQAQAQRDFEAGQAARSMEFESSQAQANRAWQETQAAKQMSFQERMSSSAHQRAMSDLRRAGLNPILAAKQPASAPGGAMGGGAQARGSMARGVRAEVRNIFQGIDASTAGNVLQAEASINVAREEADRIFHATNLLDAQEFTEESRQALVSAQARVQNLEATQKEIMMEIMREELKEAKRKYNLSDTEYGKRLRYIEMFFRAIGGGAHSYIPRGKR